MSRAGDFPTLTLVSDSDTELSLTELSSVVQFRDAAGVRQKLAWGADPNVLRIVYDSHRRVRRAETPLITAARLGLAEIVEILVAGGAALDMRDDTTGRNALHWACTSKQPGIVRTLALAGAPVDNTNIDGETPIVEALIHRDLDLIVFLIERGIVLERRINYDRDTALLLAVQIRLWPAARELLRAGAGVLWSNRYNEDVLGFLLRDSRLAHPDFTELLGLIMSAGGRFRTLHLQRCKQRGPEWTRLARSYTSRPRSLLGAARLVIRTALLDHTGYSSILHSVSCLPVPDPLKRLLTFDL